MKKYIVMAGCALVLAACTQKTATPTENTPTNPPAVQSTKSPAASAMAESSSSSMMKDGKYTFKLAALNNSKQDGTVTFSEVSGKVKVSIDVANASVAAEPAHIHMGKCPTPGDVKYPLTNVVSGKSETVLPADVTLEKLMAMGDLSVNVHKSATELKTYLSCGNLDWKAAGATMMKASPTASAKASTMVKASAMASASASTKATATPKAQ